MWLVPFIWIIWIIIIIANLLKEKEKEKLKEYTLKKTEEPKTKEPYNIKKQRFKEEILKKQKFIEEEPKSPTKKEEVIIKKSKIKIIDLSSKDKVKEAIILSEILKGPKAFNYLLRR